MCVCVCVCELHVKYGCTLIRLPRRVNLATSTFWQGRGSLWVHVCVCVYVRDIQLCSVQQKAVIHSDSNSYSSTHSCIAYLQNRSIWILSLSRPSLSLTPPSLCPHFPSVNQTQQKKTHFTSILIARVSNAKIDVCYLIHMNLISCTAFFLPVASCHSGCRQSHYSVVLLWNMLWWMDFLFVCS